MLNLSDNILWNIELKGQFDRIEETKLIEILKKHSKNNNIVS